MINFILFMTETFESIDLSRRSTSIGQLFSCQSNSWMIIVFFQHFKDNVLILLPSCLMRGQLSFLTFTHYIASVFFFFYSFIHYMECVFNLFFIFSSSPLMCLHVFPFLVVLFFNPACSH